MIRASQRTAESQLDRNANEKAARNGRRVGKGGCLRMQGFVGAALETMALVQG